MTDKDLDEKLREKAINNFGQDYKKANLDNIIFLAKEKKKKIIMYRLLAYSVCVCICLGVFIYFSNLNKVEEPIVENKANVECDIDKVPIILYEIPNDYGTADMFPTYIAIIKINEVNDLGIVNLLPESNVKAEIVEVIRGDLKQSHIGFKVDESIVPISKIPQEIKEHIEVNEEENYIRLVVDEKMINASYPENGKYYVVSLIDIEDSFKVLNHCMYPINEFNINDRKVKIGSEWCDLDF